MTFKETIQRKFHMGLFRYLGKFEDLFKQEINCDNVYTNCVYLRKHFLINGMRFWKVWE